MQCDRNVETRNVIDRDRASGLTQSDFLDVEDLTVSGLPVESIVSS